MNYWEEVKQDIYTELDYDFEWLFTGVSAEEVRTRPYDVAGRIADELFNSDAITGNASGSYFCNRWMAREAVLENMELLREAYEHFGDTDCIGEDFLQERWEAMDVTIRCYLLFPVMDEVMEEISDAIDGILAEEMEDAYKLAERFAA